MDASLTQTPAPNLERLRKRWQFLAVAKGRSAARGAVVVQMLPRDPQPDQTAASMIGVGFTATRKIGGAVVRNRAKRRMREAARALLPQHGQPGCDYVLIARGGAAERPWLRLLDDVERALISLAAGGDDPKPARPSRSPRHPKPA